VVKPIKDPQVRYTPGALLIYLLILAASGAGMWWARAAGTGSPHVVTAIVVGTVAAAAMRVLVVFPGSDTEMGSGDIFLAVGIATQAPRTVSLIIVTYLVIASLFGTRSWQHVLGRLAAQGAVTGACAMLAARVNWHALTHVGGAAAEAAAMLTATLLIDNVFYVIGEAMQQQPRLTWGTIGPFLLDQARDPDHVESVWVVMYIVPIAALAIASGGSLVVTFLLVVPFLVSWRNIKQAARLKAAEAQMDIDPLTGLANRARFWELAERELELARKYGHHVSVVMADLDDFKRVNDSFGHLVGDQVLRVAAAALGDDMGAPACTAARYGGEEFIIAAPVMDEEAALQLAERLRAIVFEQLRDFGSSMSFGVAQLRRGESLDALVDRADRALYAAKFDGKNCVRSFSEGAPARIPTASQPDDDGAAPHADAA
jgi:diguanylate cyclase (GGDEF)-like protein